MLIRRVQMFSVCLITMCALQWTVSVISGASHESDAPAIQAKSNL